MKNQPNVFKAIECIHHGLESSRLKEDVLGVLESDINAVANYLGVDTNEALLFSLVFSFQIVDSTCDYRGIARFLEISEFQSIELGKHIDKLIQKKMCFKEVGSRHRSRSRPSRTEYFVNAILMKAIQENEPFPKKELYALPTVSEWLGTVYDFIEDELEYLDNREMEFVIHEKLNTRVAGGLNEFIKATSSEIPHQLFLIYAIWEALTKTTFFSPDNFFSNLPRNKIFSIKERKLLVNGGHPLLKKGVLELQPAQFGNDVEVGLTEEFKDKLKEYGVEFDKDIRALRSKATHRHETIIAKTMHYNDEEARQMQSISNLLQQANFTSLQTRMEKRGLPKGVSVLLFGSPGTGKTESVLQLAKRTGRDVIQVDISESKSMWFGQSEKIVKRIFTDYKKACEFSDVAPILFINEADAVLGMRRSGDSSVRQTENAIQNILLEELEKLEGILIATTNLEVNLDAAFDRRFLFKVKFEKPGLEQRTNIWQDKLPHYTKECLADLAMQFRLSGGQIDNIVRKTEIDFVLNGNFPNEEQLIAYCKDELALVKSVSGNRIGF